MTHVGYGRARDLLAAFRDRKVLVVGDVMLDRFIWGSVGRISPEAPVPVVRVDRETVHLGGAANVAANLASLGSGVLLTSIVGTDPAADQLRGALAAGKIDARLVEDPGRATTVKTRVIARAQQVVRVDRESDDPVEGPVREELTRRILHALDTVHAVVVSDYDKGLVTSTLLAEVLPEIRERRLPVVVDPKLTHFFSYQPITVVTPNQAEAGRAMAMEIRSDEDCLDAARSILSRLDSAAVLVTRGERGMLLLERGKDPSFIPGVAREVYDVTGAGDTVAAVLALALAVGAELGEAAVLANQAAGVVVGKVGTATVSATDLLGRMGAGEGRGAT